MYIKAVNTSYFLGRFEETQYLSIKKYTRKATSVSSRKIYVWAKPGQVTGGYETTPSSSGYDSFFMRKKKKHRKAPTFRQITFCKSIFAVQKMLFGQ